ncbi:hypothetical protein ABFS82_06G111300 [Erythranthe guttata]|uniref:Bifunctional inhibitor/plant lipid transfer protein/seed storage helical domain-containing protein n=1 Tax=Erythranthe guttata TaxID=4155 RepID=A0A022PVK0_ERYGU|nr:PREDICTED: putative non-specific lipid-transfer protein 14 [Erythranthe guttata]EYU19529.1 hypothetical protein MIMGU_mgv1a015896mg [Erythranthe guttata]|eukprot:XP_012858236.1 PREDICTED: putative non-specific lipid-transfer protein 14 [Erythranthe guttata]
MRDKFHEMVRISYIGVTVLILFWRFPAASAAGEDCSTVTALVSTCSNFVMYGSPDPIPGSPCCTAMTSLNNLADSGGGNRRTVCQCLMDLINTYSSNATAIATLPGFCGVSLGFVIDPNTDCDYVDQYAKLEGRKLNLRSL